METRGAASKGVGLLAIALWFGGLVVLGAVVAPTVFANVPAPTSGNAMTLVFRRFDKIALCCAAAALFAEMFGLIGWRARSSNLPRARLAAVFFAASLAVIEAVWLSPAIIHLHEEGAISGLGPLGQKLAEVHSYAEWAGKAQAVLLAVAIALHAFEPRCFFEKKAETGRRGSEPPP